MRALILAALLVGCGGGGGTAPEVEQLAQMDDACGPNPSAGWVDYDPAKHDKISGEFQMVICAGAK